MYFRTDTTWASVSSRLVGSTTTADPMQGQSVCLSYDGKMLAIGGDGSDGNGAGAAWYFLD